MRTYLLTLAGLAVALTSPLQAQWLSLYEQDGAERGSSFGYSMAQLGDVNGDGLPDLLVGALAEDANGLNSGAVHILNGHDGSLIRTVPGDKAGSLFGASVASLGDLNGDGIPDFAASAPFYSDLNGFFAGRAYVISGSDGSVLDFIDGQGNGILFGASVAATDVDGDGAVELAVGAVGENGADGALHVYEWNSGALVELAGSPIAGTPGSREWFGFSSENLGNLAGSAGDEIVVGAPFANDGGTESGSVTALSDLATLRHLYPSVAGAKAGFSVSAILAPGGGYIAAGAPGTTNGSAYIWNGASGALVKTLNGASVASQFGYEIQLLPDRDYDNLVEIAVGAPRENGAGRGYVIDFLEGAAPQVLLSVDGTAGSRMGATITETGDVNQTTISDLAFGAPDADAGLGRRQGHYQVWTPPDSNIGPLELNLTNTPVLDSLVTFDVTNVKENADVYLYVGTSLGSTTTAEGYTIGISGLIGGIGGNDYFELVNGLTGGSHSSDFDLPITLAAGDRVYFQAVEARGPFERVSSIDGGVIQDRPIELELSSALRVNWSSTLQTTYGHRSTSAVVYYFMGLSQGNAMYLGSVNTGLSAPYHAIGFSNPDAFGSASYTWLVPASINGAPLANRTVLLSTVSWFGGDQRLGYYGPTTIQP